MEYHGIPYSRQKNVVPLHLKTREQAAPQHRASSLHSACTVLAFENETAARTPFPADVMTITSDEKKIPSDGTGNINKKLIAI